MNVNPEDVLMQGYVLATGENIGYRMGYKRFYFVLTDCLYYYETKESFESRSKPVGSVQHRKERDARSVPAGDSCV